VSKLYMALAAIGWHHLHPPALKLFLIAVIPPLRSPCGSAGIPDVSARATTLEKPPTSAAVSLPRFPR
jgi:hypothetical protein